MKDMVMTMGNAYLDKKASREQALLDIGVTCGKQQMIDYIACVLRNPKYVGKRTLGRDAIDKIMVGLMDYDKEYEAAYTLDKEADVAQQHLDDELRQLYGDELIPFEVRQPHIRILGYDKSRKGWKD